MSELRLRPETPDDLAFLQALYESTRSDELDLTGWDAATRTAFCAMQFTAQRHHYRSYYPDASFDIVEVDDERIGRLYVNRTANIVVMDIALVPSRRSRGLGTQLMASIIDESDRSGRAISLHVEINNARVYEWYRRLGFEDVERKAMHIEMRREPRMATA